MGRIIKTAVKCYKKKTRKTVGGKEKIYEYNQYTIPLKKADKLECMEQVFIIPEKNLKKLFEVDDPWKLREYINKLKGYEVNIGNYQKEFKDLEWKHTELSKSYKELFSKHTKLNKQLKELNSEDAKSLKEENGQLTTKLESKLKEYQTLKTNYDKEIAKNKLLEDELRLQKGNDFWATIKKRLVKEDE